eukprot:CAMPEP_0171647866 /NCGR_PEP_ID=MMETSP0990-20121206/35750_1 /TAXON_ID=483369 /ORGANISM="non described non described, Strain CCMP2098" /LENGTH=132 /DNA_ID=CAMNT_0012225249 /DNA_START=96 /DNA_END=494 /DNA_ORIENTATION=+
MAEYGATEALREFMRNQDAGTIHASGFQGLRGAGAVSIDADLEEALHSARISTVQAAMEHALKAHAGEYDEGLFRKVKKWYEELDKRMGLLKYCKAMKGQGWDGECLAVDGWWNGVRYKTRLDHPWQSGSGN